MRERFTPKALKDFAEHLFCEDSIDAFLEHQEGEFLEIGKAAIAAALLAFEREANLDVRFMKERLKNFFSEERRNGNNENNWYQLLWGALNAPYKIFKENKLRIITFNYDRSLEQYLFTRLKRRFPGKTDYADKMCPIVHIHGQLGYLPWQKQPDPKLEPVPYNAMAKFYEGAKEEESMGRDISKLETTKNQWFDSASKRITVIHEEKHETKELKQAREWISDCKRLIFLGFGYHPNNVERLQIKSIGKKHFMGTIYGLSNAQKDYVHEVIQPKNLFMYTSNFFDETIYRFLHDRINLTI
jgi:hypothetical protein